uniref:HAT C-terminal dimerisation domain-containing protein n=1 Tax=Gadus morhua TaxID=8049 RepID=A0A8C5AUR6_GADMO
VSDSVMMALQLCRAPKVAFSRNSKRMCHKMCHHNTLSCAQELFRVTKFMSDQLQSPTLELSSTIDLSESVIATLSDKRAEESWIDIRDRAADLCTKAGVSQDGTCEKRRTQPPRILQEFVVEAPVESTPVTTSDAQRTHLYYPVIDRLVGEMRRRFSTEAGGVLTGVSALSPKHASFLDKKCLQPMAQFYLVTEENLKAELHQIQRLLERKKAQGHVVNDTLEFLALMRPYRDAFVDLYRLICISLTLPVTSASCERSFSCLRRIKNYLRNSSGDTRNSNLALLSINKQRTKTLDVQRIIDIFASNHKNRRIVLI